MNQNIQPQDSDTPDDPVRSDGFTNSFDCQDKPTKPTSFQLKLRKLVFSKGGRIFLFLFAVLSPIYAVSFITFTNLTQNLFDSSPYDSLDSFFCFLLGPEGFFPFTPMILVGCTSAAAICVAPRFSESVIFQAGVCTGSAVSLYFLLVCLMIIPWIAWIPYLLSAVISGTFLWIGIRFIVELFSLSFLGRFSILNFLLLLIVLGSFLTLSATIQKYNAWPTFLTFLFLTLFAGTPFFAITAYFSLSISLPIGHDKRFARIFYSLFAITGLYFFSCWVWILSKYHTASDESCLELLSILS